jgi:CRP-like cAMP-binding protein
MVDRIGTDSVRSRVAFTVANLARLHGRRERSGHLVIERLTHQDIGHMVGASRQWVTQMLKALEKERLLTCHMRRIEVLDLPGLLGCVSD